MQGTGITHNTEDEQGGDRTRARRVVEALSAGLESTHWLVLLAFVVFLLLYLSLFRNALIDDSFITFDYARSLLHGGTWGMYAGHISNTATSPLNVLLVAAATLVTGSEPEASLWLALLCFLVIGLALDRISLQLTQKRLFGRIATLAFAFNPLLISTLGLESILLATLLVLAACCYIASRWSWLAFVAGLLAITRPEGVLFALIFLLFVPRKPATPAGAASKGNIRTRFVLIFMLTSAPWYLYSWIALGSFIPDSFFLKVGAAAWGQTDFFRGLGVYMQRYTEATALSFAMLPLLATLAWKPMRELRLVRLLVLLGLAHFLGYAVLDVPPFHWYYAAEVAVIILLGGISLGMLERLTRPGTRQRVMARAAAGFFLLVPALAMIQMLAGEGFHVAEMPLHSNRATEVRYREVGAWLEEHVAGTSLSLDGEIGTLSYYCADCYLLNTFSDRRWLVEAVDGQMRQPGIPAAFYRFNFLFLRDGPDFPPYAYSLKVLETRDVGGGPYLKEWETSTRWTPDGLITLSAY